MRAWELKHRHLSSEAVIHHTLFREETRWPGYYYRGDHMKLDDENWHVLTVSRRDPETGGASRTAARADRCAPRNAGPRGHAERRLGHGQVRQAKAQAQPRDAG